MTGMLRQRAGCHTERCKPFFRPSNPKSRAKVRASFNTLCWSLSFIVVLQCMAGMVTASAVGRTTFLGFAHGCGTVGACWPLVQNIVQDKVISQVLWPYMRLGQYWIECRMLENPPSLSQNRICRLRLSVKRHLTLIQSCPVVHSKPWSQAPAP